jgi:hypothetical protein
MIKIALGVAAFVAVCWVIRLMSDRGRDLE